LRRFNVVVIFLRNCSVLTRDQLTDVFKNGPHVRYDSHDSYVGLKIELKLGKGPVIPGI